MLERLELQQQQQAQEQKRIGKTPGGNAVSQSSDMAFEPVPEEEGEDGESGYGKTLPRASAKAAGDNGEVELDEVFSDDEGGSKKRDKKSKKDKKDKKKKKSSKGGDSDGRSKSKSKSQRSKSKKGTEDGLS